MMPSRMLPPLPREEAQGHELRAELPQECINKKQEQLNYMKLGSQIEAVASMMERQAKMNIVNKNMMMVSR